MSTPINHPGGRHFDKEPSPSLHPDAYDEQLRRFHNDESRASSPSASEITEAIEDFGKWEELCSQADDNDRAKHGGMDACKASKRAARSRLESLYREQQEKESYLRKEWNLSLEAVAELQATVREQLREIEALDRVKSGYFEELVRIRAELSSLRRQLEIYVARWTSAQDEAIRSRALKDSQLTPEEASKALNAVWGYAPASNLETSHHYESLREKLTVLRKVGR